MTRVTDKCSSEAELGEAADNVPLCVVHFHNYDHKTQDPGFVEGQTHTVVLPPFFDRNASMSMKARFERGTMNPKKQLLEFDGSSAAPTAANAASTTSSGPERRGSHDFHLQPVNINI